MTIRLWQFRVSHFAEHVESLDGKKDSELASLTWSGAVEIQILTCFFLNAKVDPALK
jgi:hypothetical protein